MLHLSKLQVENGKCLETHSTRSMQSTDLEEFADNHTHLITSQDMKSLGELEALIDNRESKLDQVHVIMR